MCRNPSVALVLFVMFVAAVSAQPPSSADRSALLSGIDAKREKYAGIAKEIWGFAEVGFQETAGVAGMPTAFVATFGSGKPIIGIVGEFDALPGLSQEAQSELRLQDPARRPQARARLQKMTIG